MAAVLQSRTILCGSGRQYHYSGAMPLGIRTFRGGLAHYQTAGGRYAVDDGCWLILNEGERYTLDIQSPAPVRSTVVFFPAGWADLVARLYRERPELLLDEPGAPGAPVRFLEATVPHDETISPRLQALDAACRGQSVENGWLEERLRDLLAAMLLSQRDHQRRAARLPAARAGTRKELYRRLCRGRDFMRAEALGAPALVEAAAHACLSPYHFQRAYTACFGESPHATARRVRLDQAERLLRQTRQPATEIAAAVGYESYGAFSTAFVRRRKMTPTAFRKN
ncbi:MAG: helix-turn-helix transcriptional regulator [Opitutae bacterium]|nr:helix-turn-helix transcriptional regulator [Opitutae bacterium]